MTTPHDTRDYTRRRFLTASGRVATGSWFTLSLPWVAALSACNVDETKAAGFQHLTRAEVRTMRAFAAQIIPSGDGTPGADEARVVNFVDRAFGMKLYAASIPLVREGLADLDRRARALGARAGFSALTFAEQTGVMRQVDQKPYFSAARALVIVGMVVDPSYGGNAGGVGWNLIGMEHQPSYSAPFGWYDAQEAG
jgi:gluconate 2-dehydrogenase gamma chain